MVILFLGHALLLGTVIVSRKHHDVQIVIFLLVAAVLGFAERLNEILGRHWQLVTRSNVFDKSGAFMAFVWGIPLLCIMTLQVIQF